MLPGELSNFPSLVRLYENFKSTEPQPLKNCPFYIIRLILIARSTLYIVLLKVLIGLSTRGLTNNRKSLWRSRNRYWKKQKIHVSMCRIFWISRNRALCEFFPRCSCGNFVGFSLTWQKQGSKSMARSFKWSLSIPERRPEKTHVWI